jgi:putative tryptophan/tyrosine transport system substrate-binding protein
MTKQFFFGLVSTFFLTNSSVDAAHEPARIRRIGFLTGQNTPISTSLGPNIDAFRQGLQQLGYIEGKNIIIEYRGADGKIERMSGLVAELIGLGVNVIVTVGMPAVIAAKQATRTIPIVTANADNLVDAGIVNSLAHPGGNVTGSTRVDADFSAKRLEILKESFPKLSRVAVLSHGSLGGDEEELQEIQTAGRKLAIQVQSYPTPDPNQFSAAFMEMKKQHADALIFLSSSFTSFHRKSLVELATQSRLPTMCANSAWIEAGCVMAYGPSVSELYRRAAVFVDKILKGAKPADLPVEQPTKFDFIINLKAAKQISLTMPPEVLGRANRIIR